MRFTLPLLTIALLAGACSSGQPESSSLAVLDAGNVLVMDGDGSNVVRITEGSETYFQPVWSTDGEMLAFSQVGSEPGLHVAFADGGSAFGSETTTEPFYFSWSPNGDVALLRRGGNGLVLEQFSISDDSLSDPTQIDTGQPLYYSWSPDGDSMATHIGTERLETMAPGDGVGETLGIEPGAFQAPRWTDRGIFAVEQGLRDQRLVVIAPDGTSTPVATIPGPATFVATDTGDRVAVQSVAAGGNGLSASLQTLPNVSANRLVVVDIDQELLTPVTSDPVLAYFWSPSGERLLILDVVAGPQARWSVWSEGEIAEVVRFDPDPSFMTQMVPFFDQYAQSLSLWAPDGSAFAFPGTVDGEQGIWVADLGGGIERVSPGTWVSWSP